jgi:iron complex outermembrane recepter protein
LSGQIIKIQERAAQVPQKGGQIMRSGLVKSACVIMAIICAAPAFAQSTPTEENGRASDIVVTAQRREQELADVPIAISAYTPETMRTLAVSRTVDLVDTIPNLVGSNNTSLGSANVYFLRGQGQDESFPTFDPAVGTYVDEIFYTRQNGNNISLFDVERLEVLRGPQGTLFGKNTTGGAINVVLRKPGKDFGGFVEASYGKFAEKIIRGSIDLPASEGARFKISGFAVDDNGWIFNSVINQNINDRRSYGGRFAADIDVSDTINWYSAVDYIYDSGTNITAPDTIVADNSIATGNFGQINQISTSRLPLGLSAVFPGAVSKAQYGSVTKSFNVSSNLKIDVGSGSVSLIAGYRKVDNDFLVNFPLPAVNANDDIFIIDNIGDFKQHSVELKYNGNLFDDAVNLTAGVYYLKEDNRTDFANYFAAALPGADRIFSNDTRNLAGYAQADIKLGEMIIVTAGVRYTDEKKSIDVVDNRPTDPVGTLPSASTDLYTVNIAARGNATTLQEKVWTPRFAVTLMPSEDAMFYVSATRGFRSGGWNARQNVAAQVSPFLAETVWSYEAGTRLSFGPRFDIYATAFHIDVSNLQVNTATAGGTFQIGNTGKMKNSGLEIEAFFRPADRLNFYAALGYQNARYRPSDAEIAACAAAPKPQTRFGAFDGNCNIASVKRTPEYQITAGGSYKIDAGMISITPRASVRMVSDHITTSRNRGAAEGFALFNAGIDFGLIDDALTMSAECANCFNSRYVVATFGSGDTYFNRPGTWTIRARYNF